MMSHKIYVLSLLVMGLVCLVQAPAETQTQKKTPAETPAETQTQQQTQAQKGAQAQAQIRAQAQAKTRAQTFYPLEIVKNQSKEKGKDKEVVLFQVEIAKTYAQKQKGLMGRESLADNYGMLFIFHPPQLAHFWMKNTYIPLDIIFIDEKGFIESIATRRDINSNHISSSLGAVAYVLEVKAGTAKRFGIKRGDFVRLLPSVSDY